MKPADNERLTRVEGDAPMGQMLRANHWFPAIRSGRLQAGGAPRLARLLGEDMVAFRVEDGRVGVLQARCPHRGASLVLAHNRDCALTCIFHGWKIGVDGQVLDVPTEARNAEEFARNTPVRRYPAHEAGGIVWVWMGQGEPAAFRDLAFIRVADTHRFLSCTRVSFNWMQALEATVDSAHIGVLHRDWIARLPGDADLTVQSLAPTYEIEPAPYGLRAVALRALPDGETYARVTEYVAPFGSITLPFRKHQAAMQLVVPVDDTTTDWWFVQWSLEGPLDRDEKLHDAHNQLDARIDFTGPPDTWGQDREGMARGETFSGFDRGVLFEDAVVQASMGPIADRSQERLTSADLAVMRVRRLLLDNVADYLAGRRPRNADPDVRLDGVLPSGGRIPAGVRWQDAFPAVAPRSAAKPRRPAQAT